MGNVKRVLSGDTKESVTFAEFRSFGCGKAEYLYSGERSLIWVEEGQWILPNGYDVRNFAFLPCVNDEFLFEVYYEGCHIGKARCLVVGEASETHVNLDVEWRCESLNQHLAFSDKSLIKAAAKMLRNGVL